MEKKPRQDNNATPLFSEVIHRDIRLMTYMLIAWMCYTFTFPDLNIDIQLNLSILTILTYWAPIIVIRDPDSTQWSIT